MSEQLKESNISKLPMRCAVYLAVTITVVFCILGTMDILRSTSSTAAIGFIVLPLAAVIVFMIAGFVGYWAGVIIQGVFDRQYMFNIRFFLGIIVIVPVLYYSLTYSSELISTYHSVNKITVMNAQELEQAYVNRPTNTLYGYDIFVIAAIAQNPNASSTLLDKIAHLKDPRMNDRLGSLIDLTKQNRKGLAAIRLVALNPNTSEKTLEYLTDSDNYYLLGDLASNTKLPEEFLIKLFERSKNNDEGYLIEWGLAYNRNTPVNILRQLAKKIKYGTGFDPINSALKNNPNTPEDVRKLLFE